MTTSTIAQDSNETDAPHRRRKPSWQLMGTLFVALIMLAVGIWLRLHDLGVPFDRDSYDEGVYWQTLRSMSTGHSLYQQTFYSQPPIFILSVYPFYALFGQSIWAARLGIVVISLIGLLGAALLGWALRRHIGVLVALLLLVANPLYLAQSQTLEAEMPCVAFALLSVALVYLWWEHPDGAAGIVLAVLTSVTAVLSIFGKLFGLAVLVPIVLLALAHVWRVYRRPMQERQYKYKYSMTSLLIGIAAAAITGVLLLLPFISSWHQLVQSVITFHLAASKIFHSSQANNFSIISQVLVTPLGLLALLGTIVALLRRDWLVLPLLAWMLATLYLLWNEVPLFTHHLVILVPPLVALVTMCVIPFLFSLRLPQRSVNQGDHKGTPLRWTSPVIVAAAIIMLLFVVADSGINLLQSRSYLREVHGQAMSIPTSPAAGVVADIRAETQPGQLIITDAQFLVAQAGRSTPSDLVDTSSVRIQSGYLTSQQLISAAALPQVH
ncbi:MAG TPA: phospholipid carrier-dependent glycosyltransferase, partial [Ktedonobacteraceae bacterium]